MKENNIYEVKYEVALHNILTGEQITNVFEEINRNFEQSRKYFCKISNAKTLKLPN